MGATRIDQIWWSDWQLLEVEDTIPVDLFKSEVQAWAKEIGVEPKEIHLRPMKR